MVPSLLPPHAHLPSSPSHFASTETYSHTHASRAPPAGLHRYAPATPPHPPRDVHSFPPPSGLAELGHRICCLSHSCCQVEGGSGTEATPTPPETPHTSKLRVYEGKVLDPEVPVGFFSCWALGTRSHSRDPVTTVVLLLFLWIRNACVGHEDHGAW